MSVFNRLLRNLINLILSMGAALGCLVMTLLMLIANYMACQVSFVLLGYDQQPLNTDRLLGQLFDAFVPKASLTHLYALVVAVMVSAGLFMVFRVMFKIFELYKERRHYLNAGDRESARIIVQWIAWHLIELIAFAIPLAEALRWDVELFRFRSICGAAGIEDAETATSLKTWGLQMSENSSLWAWTMTARGAWGYISVTALSAILFEHCLRRVSENWAKLLGTFEDIVSPPADEEVLPAFYGYDADGRPVYDPDTPVSYDVNGNPLHDPEDARRQQQPSGRGTRQDTQSDFHAESPPSADEPFGAANPEEDRMHEPLFASSAQDDASRGRENGSNGGGVGQEGCTAEKRGPTREEALLRAVIGDGEGKRVSLADALQHPERYWVDPDTYEVWDAAYRSALFGGHERPAP